MLAGMLAVHLGRSEGPSGAMPSLAARYPIRTFYRCLQAATCRAVRLHDEATGTSQAARARADGRTRRIGASG